MQYLKIPPALDRRRKLTVEDIADIKALYASGLLIGTIARLYRKAHSTIEYWVNTEFALKRKLEARRKNALKRQSEAYRLKHRALTAASHRYKREVCKESERAFDALQHKEWKHKNPEKWKAYIEKYKKKHAFLPGAGNKHA